MDITRQHIEMTRLDSSGNKYLLYPKTTLADVHTSSTSGVTIEGKVNFFGACSTAADNATKTVDINGFSLVAGAHVTVIFTNGISVADATLNINSTGDKSIYYNGAAITANQIRANERVQMVYDGSQFHVISCSGFGKWKKLGTEWEGTLEEYNALDDSKFTDGVTYHITDDDDEISAENIPYYSDSNAYIGNVDNVKDALSAIFNGRDSDGHDVYVARLYFANSAVNDSNGNNIYETYATKEELNDVISDSSIDQICTEDSIA